MWKVAVLMSSNQQSTRVGEKRTSVRSRSEARVSCVNISEAVLESANMLDDLIAKGVKIKTRGMRCAAVGFDEQKLIDGVEMGRMIELAQWTKESDSVVAF